MLLKGVWNASCVATANTEIELFGDTKGALKTSWRSFRARAIR